MPLSSVSGMEVFFVGSLVEGTLDRERFRLAGGGCEEGGTGCSSLFGSKETLLVVDFLVIGKETGTEHATNEWLHTVLSVLGHSGTKRE